MFSPMGLCKAIGHGGQREPVDATVAFLASKYRLSFVKAATQCKVAFDKFSAVQIIVPSCKAGRPKEK
jgi:hypothetical protein